MYFCMVPTLAATAQPNYSPGKLLYRVNAANGPSAIGRRPMQPYKIQGNSHRSASILRARN